MVVSLSVSRTFLGLCSLIEVASPDEGVPGDPNWPTTVLIQRVGGIGGGGGLGGLGGGSGGNGAYTTCWHGVCE
jgi:hypothetical protein